MIKRFEPWMALSFTEGSIGGDIERVNLDSSKRSTAKTPVSAGLSTGRRDDDQPNPRGSNGMAIAPSNTAGASCAAADQSAHFVLLPL